MGGGVGQELATAVTVMTGMGLFFATVLAIAYRFLRVDEDPRLEIVEEMLPGNMAVIKAVVPLAEVADYNSRLSSITGGQGSYHMEFSHYEQVPAHLQQKIIEASKKEKEESS